MRNPQLHDALRGFAEEAASLLTADLDSGAELCFDVVEEAGTSAPLYRYRPLVEEFISERWDRIRFLQATGQAQRALASGASAYLRHVGRPDGGSEPALRAMLERLYEDATSFSFPRERFERVYAEVEQTLYAHTIKASVVAAVLGVRLTSDRVDLGEGLALVRGDLVDAPQSAVWPDSASFKRAVSEPNTLCVVDRDLPSEASLPIAEAKTRFGEVVTALRVFKEGGCALAAVGFAKVDAGAWRAVGLSSNATTRGERLVLSSSDEARLRDFISVLQARSWPAHIDWALARFEMGCERQLDHHALSDYLLALRALLDGYDEVGRAGLSLRLAALCADEPDRRAVQRRIELALSLERYLMEGGQPAEFAEARASELVKETERYLRALLWDVISGFLDSDLKACADDLLLAGESAKRGEARSDSENSERSAGSALF